MRRTPDDPMAGLSRVVALAMVRGPRAGPAAVTALEDRLAGHHRLDAVRAHLLDGAGDHEAARAAYRRAAARTLSSPEARYLRIRADRPAPAPSGNTGDAGNTETPGTPETPETPGTPGTPGVPGTSGMPGTPGPRVITAPHSRRTESPNPASLAIIGCMTESDNGKARADRIARESDTDERLGGQSGVRPTGRREAAGAYGEVGPHRSVAGITGPGPLAEVRSHEHQAKAADRTAARSGQPHPTAPDRTRPVNGPGCSQTPAGSPATPRYPFTRKDPSARNSSQSRGCRGRHRSVRTPPPRRVHGPRTHLLAGPGR
ncbi:hypothetical protein [Streptomyces sp.]|uniref:hypothetical protein n=1 Tax=Streptomyces sp. TaxID=1931 RepID=UPI0039C90F14